SFRAPSQEELYSEGPHLASYSFEIGNPDLTPERGLGKELFLRYRGNAISAEVTGFHNGFSNYIYPRNTGRASIRFPSLNEYQFIGADAELYGFELSGEWQFQPGLAVTGSASYTLGRRKRTEEEQALTGSGDSYRSLPMIPPLKGNLGLKYGGSTYQGGFRLRWATEQNRTGEFETPTAGFMVFDLFGQYRFQKGNILHTLSLNIENLLDDTYRSHLSRIKELVPEPGRNVSLLYRIYF
ncbi:MAG: TonB-dependent receptor, partial [Balneolaceae bacterium]|nr:TonB-dependent receptor [Balneolaceae bacterium]